MARIELDRISKLYPGGAVGVHEVSLTIEEGEFVVLLGPSGCGKSTTLRMIAGLEEISAGRLMIDGRDMTDVPPRARNVAVVFQSYALYPHMTVRANIGFPLKMRGMPAAEIATRIEAAAEMLGLVPYLDRKPGALSGGQRQRVALGRAVVREPAAFLFDEPLSNLDAQLRGEMRAELVRLHRSLGRSIVHVTHDQAEAMTMGDRICIMRAGRLIQAGAPLDVYADPVDMFVARFLATPAINFLPGRLAAEAGALNFVAGSDQAWPLPERHRAAYGRHAGRPVILGLRPEDLHAAPAPGRQKVAITVTGVEALGPETVVTGRIDAAPGAVPGLPEIRARLGRDLVPHLGEAMVLHADLMPAHLYHPETEAALPRPSLRARA
ncbi:MAG: ABC transporter ATP-binding protein [Roseovarius sp.]|nr:ABC transporter ATP-binding protein [Roseovarius sp.]